MAHIIEINNIDSEYIKIYSRLTETQLRNRLDPQMGIFIAESPKVIRVAIENGCQPLSFLMERRHIDGQARDLIAQYPDLDIYTGEREILARITGFELTRGILCAMRRPTPADPAEICRNCHRIAVLDGVVNAENTGAIFRAAAALGMDALLINHNCCDPLNRRSVRVSMGTVFQIPWAYLQPDEGLIPQLESLGFATAAMALSDKAISIADPRLKQEDRLAIILGTEGDGLPQEIIGNARYVVKIPMQNHVDSLNVAAAAAVAFWEVLR